MLHTYGYDYYRPTWTVDTFRSLYCIHRSLQKTQKHSIATITPITEFEIIDSKHTTYVKLYELIDLWVLDSNRRVGVWSLPWRWHILSILLTAGRATGAKTCGLDDVFPPDDLCSRSSVLFYIYIYIYMYIYVCILYTSSVIWRIYTYNRSVVQYWWSCTPSQSFGLFFGECMVPGLNATFVFFGLPSVSCSMIKSLILGCLWLVFVLKNILTLGIWRSAISHFPGCFVFWPSFRISDSTTFYTESLPEAAYYHEVCVLDLNWTVFSMATRGSILGNFE